MRIEHPSLEAITGLGLQWLGMPAVSSMMLECGGLQFPGAPFAGWYQGDQLTTPAPVASSHLSPAGTEVASRDFLDPQRYNLLRPLGEAMGLDMSSNATLWKVRAVCMFITECTECDQDEVALELNKAVLHSYKMAGVTIVDHFTQADQVSQQTT